MKLPSVIILSEREAAQRGLVETVEAGGSLEVVACVSDPSALAGLAALHAGSQLLLAFDEKGDLMLDAIEALAPPRPPFVVLGPEEDGRVILRAMRLGAREFLPLQVEGAALRSTLEALTPLAEAGAPLREGLVVAVLGAKGGVGASFVASQLALALRQLGAEVALVDLALRHGDQSLQLDLQPRYTVADVARRDGPVDATYLTSVLSTHPSGLHLLAAPLEAEDAELVGSERVAESLDLARGMHDWVLLDLGRSFDEVSLRALDLANEILLVTARDIPTLHHTRRSLALLERLGHPASKLHLVVNRSERGSPVSERDAAAFLGRPADLQLPNDWEAAQESSNYGKPLLEVAPRSALRTAFDELACSLHEWCGLPRPAAPESSRGVLRAASLLRRKLRGAD